MNREENLAFVERFKEIHRKSLRKAGEKPAAGETAITPEWTIEYSGANVRLAADDFAEFLAKTMETPVAVKEVPAGAPLAARVIRLNSTAALKNDGWKREVTADNVIISGEFKGLFSGLIELEDLMTLRKAPFVEQGSIERTPMLKLRSVHSGHAWDDFPDWELMAIKHAGFNAIEVYLRGVDQTARHDNIDLNALIQRAEDHGLYTIFYNTIHVYKHPDEPDADEYFARTLGDVLRRYPKARAIGLVGENLSFPSKDPHTTGRRRQESSVDGIPDHRPSPGWYPCFDYPAYLRKLEKAVHDANPDIEIFFSTYNWGYQPWEARKKFIENFPERMSLWVPWELFKSHSVNGVHSPVMDYSIAADTPGEFFLSEMKQAAKQGIPFRSFTHLAGCTWDLGCIPYVPVFQRWKTRHFLLRQYIRDYNVANSYDNHHFGWYPNPLNELAKAVLTSPGITEEEWDKLLLQLADRDYGKVADKVVAAWQAWSDSMDYYVASNEDQYGPWRVGPAYPFHFQGVFSRTMIKDNTTYPCARPGIINTEYFPRENSEQSPGALRYPIDLERLAKMREIWNRGMQLLEEARKEVEPDKAEALDRMYALGKFIRNSINTVENIKHWYLKSVKMLAAETREEIVARVDELLAVLDREEANVNDTFECVDCDSRLGWEPTMGYVADRWHLEWKLRQLAHARWQLQEYRRVTLM